MMEMTFCCKIRHKIISINNNQYIEIRVRVLLINVMSALVKESTNINFVLKI